MTTDVPVRRILVLASNPGSTSRLRLDEEVREIDEGLRRAKHRDQFELIHRWAVRPRDIHRALLDIEPDIVHFSGHGTGKEGLVFEDELGEPKLVTQEAIAELFKLFSDRIKCVVLNGCYSQVQAEVISQYIPYVIGMSQSINDRTAITFSIGFYDALGAGRSFEFSHRLGCVALKIEDPLESFAPTLNRREVSNLTDAASATTRKDRIEKELEIPFFENLVDIVKERVQCLSDMQAAYYVGVIVTGVEECFSLRNVERFFGEKSFTYWFLLKGLSQLDVSRQKRIISCIQKDEYEHGGFTMLAFEDLIDAAGGIRGEHYYQDGNDRIFIDAGWDLLAQVFSHEELSTILEKARCSESTLHHE